MKLRLTTFCSVVCGRSRDLVSPPWAPGISISRRSASIGSAQPDGPRPKVAYSQEAVELFDRAAQIAKAIGDSGVSVNHLLAAFAAEEGGLMGELKRTHGITSASWRAAIARIGVNETNGATPESAANEKKVERDYLTPEEAAEALGIHVQTMRAYIRSERLPAFRLAGERAIRILRTDLEKVLEPLRGEK